MQIENFDDTRHVLDQPVKPMFLLSGSFRRPKGFRIYTDHQNLRFIYGTYRTQKINVMCRYERWAIKLLKFRYTIEHVPGERNLWADLLSRWGETMCVASHDEGKEEEGESEGNTTT